MPAIMLEDEILTILEECASEIRANMDAKGINASHTTERAIHTEQEPGSLSLVIQGDVQRSEPWGSFTQRPAPADTLELGRPAGDVPGGFVTLKDGRTDISNTFKSILSTWAHDKGIIPKEQSAWGFATIVGRRIAEKGTVRNSAHEDVYSTPVNKAITKLENLVGIRLLGRIEEQIPTNF